MAALLGNKVVRNIGTTATTVLTATASQRYTLLGLSFTNTTNMMVYLDVLVNDAYYLKDIVLPTGTSLRAISTGEKLILGHNVRLSVKSSADDSVDVIASYAAIAYQSLPDDVHLVEGTAINLIRTDENNISIGVDFDQLQFRIAADDSTVRSIKFNESIKIIGGTNINTYSDEEGNITIDGPNIGDFVEYSNTSFSFTTDDERTTEHNLDANISFIGGNDISTYTNGDGNIVIDSNVDLSPYALQSSLSVYALQTTFNNYTESNDIYFSISADSIVNPQNFVTNNENLRFKGIGYISTTVNANKQVEIRWNGANEFVLADDVGFKTAADDAVERSIANGDTIQFIGGNNVATTSDVNGNITFDTTFDLDPTVAAIALG